MCSDDAESDAVILFAPLAPVDPAAALGALGRRAGASGKRYIVIHVDRFTSICLFSRIYIALMLIYSLYAARETGVLGFLHSDHGCGFFRVDQPV